VHCAWCPVPAIGQCVQDVVSTTITKSAATGEALSKQAHRPRSGLQSVLPLSPIPDRTPAKGRSVTAIREIRRKGGSSQPQGAPNACSLRRKPGDKLLQKTAPWLVTSPVYGAGQLNMRDFQAWDCYFLGKNPSGLDRQAIQPIRQAITKTQTHSVCPTQPLPCRYAGLGRPWLTVAGVTGQIYQVLGVHVRRQSPGLGVSRPYRRKRCRGGLSGNAKRNGDPVSSSARGRGGCPPVRWTMASSRRT